MVVPLSENTITSSLISSFLELQEIRVIQNNMYKSFCIFSTLRFLPAVEMTKLSDCLLLTSNSQLTKASS